MLMSAFKARFEQLAEQYPNFSFQVFYTQEEDTGERLNQDHLALVDNIENSLVYACGPSGFVATGGTAVCTMHKLQK